MGGDRAAERRAEPPSFLGRAATSQQQARDIRTGIPNPLTTWLFRRVVRQLQRAQPRGRQNDNLNTNCSLLGNDAALYEPNAGLICFPVASNLADVSTPLKFV